MGFDIIILNSGWLNTSAIKVSVCLRLITKSGLFVWPLTSFDFHQITNKLQRQRLSCTFLLHQYQLLNINEEKVTDKTIYWDINRFVTSIENSYCKYLPKISRIDCLRTQWQHSFQLWCQSFADCCNNESEVVCPIFGVGSNILQIKRNRNIV